MKVNRIFKISNKLLISFFIIIGLMIFVGVQSILFLKSIENRQKQITSSLVVSDAVLEAKYFVRSDVHILYEMVYASKKEDIAYWWGEHQFQVQFVNDQIKTIKKALTESESLSGNIYKDPILELTNTFELDFGLKIKSKIEEAHGLLNETFTVNSNERSLLNQDQRVMKILKEVSTEGLTTIKGLDKVKEYTKKIVEEAEKSSTSTVETSLKTTWIVGIASIVIALAIALFFSSRISNAIIKLKGKVEQLSKGRHTEELEIRNRDELGAIANSLNQLIFNLKQLSQFALEVGNRNFKTTYEAMGEDDILGNSLIEMRNKLEQAEMDASARRKEEEQRVYV
ncbi:MAG TPA: methyl-accepting chemotaxis protein, partial [Bacteroidales bacterium]|nr:methyl-accepting chemotaxis protein [Bacteroidales bacterium]